MEILAGIRDSVEEIKLQRDGNKEGEGDEGCWECERPMGGQNGSGSELGN
jgi:hypothetical protein